ncbi:MAG: hypothetical protein ACWIPJ_00495, partial [Polaribacter sp.]
TYEFANDFYVVGQSFISSSRTVQSIDGSGVRLGSNEFLDKGVNVITTVVSLTRSAALGGKTLKGGLGYVSKVNASQFSSIFKGNLARLVPKTRGFINKQILNKTISVFNNQMSGGMFLFSRVKALKKK